MLVRVHPHGFTVIELTMVDSWEFYQHPEIRVLNEVKNVGVERREYCIENTKEWASLDYEVVCK